MRVNTAEVVVRARRAQPIPFWEGKRQIRRRLASSRYPKRRIEHPILLADALQVVDKESLMPGEVSWVHKEDPKVDHFNQEYTLSDSG